LVKPGIFDVLLGFSTTRTTQQGRLLGKRQLVKDNHGSATEEFTGFEKTLAGYLLLLVGA
jgi:hypothetical protein